MIPFRKDGPGALSRYLREISVFPLLEKEDEQKLVRRLKQGDADAASSLVESNLSFVVKIASEYRTLGMPFEDLLNEGNLGLIEAANRFNPAKGTRFITYAIWWIRKKMLKAIADHSLVVRVPQYRRKKVYDVKRAESTLRGALGRQPTREEVAGHLSVSVKQVDHARRQSLVSTSLDQEVGEDSATPLHEFLTDDKLSAEQKLLTEEAGHQVALAFQRLTPREQAVLGWRLALGRPTPLTLKQVGERLDISRERVRQIESVAKIRLRRMLAEIPAVHVAGEAATGQEALRLIPLKTPDALLLDISMPGLDGMDVLKSIRLRDPQTDPKPGDRIETIVIVEE